MKVSKFILNAIVALMVCVTAGAVQSQVSEKGFNDEFNRVPKILIKKGSFKKVSSFDGALQAPLANSSTNEAIYKDRMFKDGVITTDLVVYNGSNAHGNGGIIFRANGFDTHGRIQNGYYVGAKPNSSGVKGVVMLGKFSQGKWHLIKEVSASVNVGNNQAIKVDAFGSKIKVYHDGKKLIDINDSSFRQGGVGFRTWRIPTLYKNFNVTSVFFDNFSKQPDLNVKQGIFNQVHSFGGSLQGNITAGVTTLAIFEDEVFKNGTIETNMTAYRGENIHGNSGVVFRVEGYTNQGLVKNGYSVSLKAKSPGVESVVILGKYTNGNWKPLKEVKTSVTYGENHNQRLKVKVSGSKINVYHDGNLKISHIDGSYKKGDIGVYSYSVPSLYKDFKIVRGSGSHRVVKAEKSNDYRKPKTGSVEILNTENYPIDKATFAVSFRYDGKQYYTAKTLNGFTKGVISELVLNAGGEFNGTSIIGDYLLSSERAANVPSWSIHNCTGDITSVNSALVLSIDGKEHHIYKQWDNLTTDHMYKIINDNGVYDLKGTY